MTPFFFSVSHFLINLSIFLWDLVSICYIARLVYFHNCYAFFILFHIFLWMDFMINGLACLGTSLFSVCARLRKRNASFTIFVIVLLFFREYFVDFGKNELWYVGLTMNMASELVKLSIFEVAFEFNYCHYLDCIHSYLTMSTWLLGQVLWICRKWPKMNCHGQFRNWLLRLLFSNWNLASLRGFWAIGSAILIIFKQI